jgi:hypothetical protein
MAVRIIVTASAPTPVIHGMLTFGQPAAGFFFSALELTVDASKASVAGDVSEVVPHNPGEKESSGCRT